MIFWARRSRYGENWQNILWWAEWIWLSGKIQRGFERHYADFEVWYSEFYLERNESFGIEKIQSEKWRKREISRGREDWKKKKRKKTRVIWRGHTLRDFFSRTIARSEGRKEVIWRSDTKWRKEKGDLERPHPWEIFWKSRTIERKKDLHPIVLFFKQAFFEESYKLCMLSRYALYHLCFEILWICMLLWILFILDVILRCLDVCLIALIYVWSFDLPLLKQMLCVILPN